MKTYTKTKDKRKYIRCHPVNIIENTSKYFLFLLLPLVRALFTYSGGFQAWFRGAWFDLIVISAILALGIYHWYCFMFVFADKGIYIVKGFLLKQRRFIPYANISSLSYEKPWYFFPFRASRLKADTDGGTSKHFDFAVTINKVSAEHILSHIKTMQDMKFKNPTPIKTYIPKNINIAIFSFITSNSIAGVLYLATAITQFSNIFGDELERQFIENFKNLARKFGFGLPPFAAILAYTMLGCWAVAFVINIINHIKFDAKRKNTYLEIRCGVITRREFIVDIEHINFLLIRQTMLSKILGFFSVFINCTGYGKNKNELSVLLPSGEAGEIRTNLKFLLQEFPIVKAQIKPKINNLPRFIIFPISLVVGIILLCFVLLYFFRGYASFIIFSSIAAISPSTWWLVVKSYSYLFTGVGVEGNIVTLYYTRGFGIYTSSLSLDRISKIQFSQTAFQQLYDGCDINFYTFSEKIKKQTVSSLNIDDAKLIFKYLNLSQQN